MQYTNNKTLKEQMREIRGFAIISKGDTPNKISKNKFTIPSQSGKGHYIIMVGKKKTCTCPDFENRKKPCKHIHAINFYLDFNNKVKTQNKSIVTEKQSCPYCKGSYTVGCGKRQTKRN